MDYEALIREAPDLSEQPEIQLFSKFKEDAECGYFLKPKKSTDGGVAGLYTAENTCISLKWELSKKFDEAISSKIKELDIQLVEMSSVLAEDIFESGIELPNTEKNASDEIDFDVSSISIKGKRWGRQHDRLLFKTIRSLENKGLISIEHIMKLKVVQEAVKDEQTNLLARKVGWTGPIRNLVKRIKSLCVPHPFSIREMKLMRRLIRRTYLFQKIDYEELTDNFPGRTLEFITPIVKDTKMKMTASVTR
jgi:hypothetical protein